MSQVGFYASEEITALDFAIRFHSPAAAPATRDDVLATAAAFRDFLKEAPQPQPEVVIEEVR